ncbi:MAG: hypothetical protein OCC45_05645 [Desulfotalea sp.]
MITESSPIKSFATELTVFDKTESLLEIQQVIANHNQKVEFSTYVGNRVAIIANQTLPQLEDNLQNNGFTTLHIPANLVLEISGQIGSFSIICLIDDEKTQLQSDQILINSSQLNTNNTGIYRIEDNVSLIDQLLKSKGNFRYSNSIKYNRTSCLHHHKRKDICHKCVDICSTGALKANCKKNEIELSHIECNGCGKCVGICPSGSLDFSEFPRTTFERLASHFINHTPFLCTAQESISTLPENFLPLELLNLDFIDELHLLSFIQKTGQPLVIYSEKINGTLREKVEFINNIFSTIFSKQAVYLCTSSQHILEAQKQITPLPEAILTSAINSCHKRDEMSQRLALMVGDKNYGIFTPGSSLDFGDLAINEESCTLCLSCADSCNTGALSVHSDDNTLRYQPSLCTQCGYCEQTCPEQNCLTLVPNQFHLTPAYFSMRIVAKDQLFACVECGKKYAPAKSISRIKDIMGPIFADDLVKLKSLSCCSDCKARMMLEQMINN